MICLWSDADCPWTSIFSSPLFLKNHIQNRSLLVWTKWRFIARKVLKIRSKGRGLFQDSMSKVLKLISLLISFLQRWSSCKNSENKSDSGYIASVIHWSLPSHEGLLVIRIFKISFFSTLDIEKFLRRC